MSHIFISYSRKDIDFARKIVQALAENDLDTWIDWEDIPKGQDWWGQIQGGIEQADAFLFLVSPDSVKSDVCNQEIDHAVQNGKRILPIIIHDIPPQKTHPEITKRNWIFCRGEQDDFNLAINETQNTIHTDYEWLQFHTELQVQALKWERSDHDKSLLLRGQELENAETMLGLKAGLEPQPVDLQREFLIQSRQAVNRQRRQITVGLVFGVIAMAILAVFAWGQRNNALDSEATAIAEGHARATALVNEEFARATAQVERDRAEEQAQISRAGELAAQYFTKREDSFDLSLLLAIEAFRTADTIQSRNALLDSIQTYPKLIQFVKGHTEIVKSLAFSPDGKTLASGSSDEIILWDIATWQPVGQLPIGYKSSEVWPSTVFSPDGKKLAVSRDDGTILWDVDTQQPIGQPLLGINHAIFSPDGKTLVYRNLDEIFLWDIATWQPIGQILTESSYAIFSPDGKTLAVSSDDGTILWDIATWQPIGQTLTRFSSVIFSPDGKILVARGYDGSVILFDVKMQEPIGQLLRETTDYAPIAFSQDGKLLAAWSCSNRDNNGYCVIGEISLWDLTNNQFLDQTLTEYIADGIKNVVFSPDGNTLVWESAYNDDTISLWDVEAQRPIGQPLKGHTDGFVFSIAISPDGKLLASGGCSDFNAPLCEKGEIILWELRKSDPAVHLLTEEDTQFRHANFSPDGKTLAVYSTGGTVILFNLETQQPIGQPLKGINYGSIAFSFDGKLLAEGSLGEVNLWDLETNQLFGHLIIDSTNSIHFTAFSPDGRSLVAGSDNEISLWDVGTRKLIGRLLTENDTPLQSAKFFLSAIFSPDGKMLAISDSYGIVNLFDVETQQPIGQPLITSERGSSVMGIAFSPDGKILAANSGDGAVILFDVETQQPIGQPFRSSISTTASFSIGNMIFSPDGKILATAGCTRGDMFFCAESEIRLWDVETKQPIGQSFIRYNFEQIGIKELAFSPDGKMIVSFGSDIYGNSAGILFWDVDPQSWTEKSCQRAGRNFTRAEWAQYFPGEGYRKTCDQWELESEPTTTP